MSKFQNLLAAFSVYRHPSVVAMIFFGFSAGLPFSLISTTLSAWLAEEQVSLSTIGYFSWVGIAYSTKVLWSPIVDQVALPMLARRFGMRRSWILISQIGIGLGLLWMSDLSFQNDLGLIAALAVLVAFCSATQDIVIDAYRIESAVVEVQGAMAAAYVFGYRVALLVAGAGALYLAEFFGWKMAYQCLSLAMLVGIVTTLFVKERHSLKRVPEAVFFVRLKKQGWVASFSRMTSWFSDAILGPFVEFFTRNGKGAVIILALIACYRLSDLSMGVMANPFYLELGFSKKNIADITKLFGFFMTIFGASLGGVLVMRWGVLWTLLLGAVLSALTNLFFAMLALSQPSLHLLAGIISIDNLSGGIASAALVAYLSGLTNSAYTATQYALFSSLMTLPAKLIGGISGQIVGWIGYEGFFVYSAFIGLPAVLLVLVLLKTGLQKVPANP